MNAEDVM